MTRHVKVLVTGPFGAGKSRLVRTISEIDVVSTERRMTRAGGDGKDTTTVAMDYGRVTLGDTVVHLTGTPGQVRFEFMWDILSQETDAILMVVDSTARDTFDDARQLLERFAGLKVPVMVAANKQDLPGAASLREVQRAVAPDAAGAALPCVGTKVSSVRQVLARLIEEV